jgi:hypothetical protein
MQIWRVVLALWLIISGVIWLIGPTFPLAFTLTGILAIAAAIFLLINK